MYITALVLWGAFLVVAIYIVRRERNPRMRPLAAYLIFVTVFTMASFALFTAIIVMLHSLGEEQDLERPIAAVIFLLVVFVPAFIIARWLIRKLPRPPVQP